MSLVSDLWIHRTSFVKLSPTANWMKAPPFYMFAEYFKDVWLKNISSCQNVLLCKATSSSDPVASEKGDSRIGNSHNGAHARLCCPYRLSRGEGRSCSMSQHCASSVLRKQLRKTARGVGQLVNPLFLSCSEINHVLRWQKKALGR